MFFEASTRTACSFQAAMQKLGGTVIAIKPSDASLKKGESVQGKVDLLLAATVNLNSRKER